MSKLPKAIAYNKYKKEDVVKREFKHACYKQSAKPGSLEDMHVVKETLTLKDGSKVPNLLLVPNFERSFGVTKKRLRNHEEKKEAERIDNLKMYKCRQSELNLTIARALGIQGETKKLNHSKLAESQYLYGSTISSATVLKQTYDQFWPDNRSAFSVAGLDFETDMINKPLGRETGDPIIGSYVFNNKYYLRVLKSFLKGHLNPEQEIRDYIDANLMADFFTPRGITQDDIIIEFSDHPVNLLKETAEDLHALSPDLVSIWNISFDVPMIIETCEYYGARPADIMSDPHVPREFRRFYYKKGREIKVTSSGAESPVDTNDRWDNTWITAGWQPVCGLRSYKKLRPTEAKSHSYGLDVISKRHLNNLGKFKPPGTEDMDSESFHVHMQTKDKIAYCAYALIDPALCVWIEEVTNDLSVKLPLQCYYSSIEAFPSGPKKNEDEMYHDILAKGWLQASTSGDMTTKWCKHLQTCNHWITLLEPHLCHPDIGVSINGVSVNSLANTAAFDVDVTAAYPWAGITENISKACTVFEIIGYEHLNRMEQRMIGFNLSNPKVNAVNLTKIVYRGPELIALKDQLLKDEPMGEDKPVGYDDYFELPDEQLEYVYGI